jgi:hypothetical protein
MVRDDDDESNSSNSYSNPTHDARPKGPDD